MSYKNLVFSQNKIFSQAWEYCHPPNKPSFFTKKSKSDKCLSQKTNCSKGMTLSTNISIHTCYLLKNTWNLKIDILSNNEQKCEMLAIPWTASFLNHKRYHLILTSFYQKKPCLVVSLCSLQVTLNKVYQGTLSHMLDL